MLQSLDRAKIIYNQASRHQNVYLAKEVYRKDALSDRIYHPANEAAKRALGDAARS
jgi:hypothetical protein